MHEMHGGRYIRYIPWAYVPLNIQNELKNQLHMRVKNIQLLAQ